MLFDAGALQSRLAGCRIGGRLHCAETVDSTNRVAMERARAGAPEGTVVLADSQTAGRGRLQRSWQSPPGCNLYLSVVLRPAIPPHDAPQMTLLAGVAAAETIAAVLPGRVRIKWPNDLLVGDRKVCGILTETRMAAGGIDFVIVGIGLNINMRRAEFAAAHRETATSLCEEAGRELSRGELLVSLCERFGQWYDRYLRYGFSPVRERWLSRCGMAGERLRIRFGDGEQEGAFAGIDHDGALLIADEQGALRRVTAGDATIMKG